MYQDSLKFMGAYWLRRDVEVLECMSSFDSSARKTKDQIISAESNALGFLNQVGFGTQAVSWAQA